MAGDLGRILLRNAAWLVDTLLGLYWWVMVVRALLSWVGPDPYNPIVRALHGLTEPVLAPIRRRLPFMAGIDLSPLVVLLAVELLRRVLGELFGVLLHRMP
jgi:YggT family protein